MRPDGRRSRSNRRPGRGQASVIGVVLVVAITVMGTTGILYFGTQALTDARTQSEVDAAAQAMTQLDSQFSLTALGSASSQRAEVDLGSGASLRTDGSVGWMNVTAINQTTDEVTTVMNVTMGAVIYENDGTTVAYQGGGVWKRTGDGSVMVSPPEFHYRTASGGDPTLTLPLVTVRGSGSIPDGRAQVQIDETTGFFPVVGDPDRSNPLTAGEINVTVQSEYYLAWGSFFEDRTASLTTYDHDRQTVTVTLVIPPSTTTVEGGIITGAASSTLEFGNSASSDSYNSSAGPYSVTGAQSTSIIAAGDVDMANKAEIRGDLRTGGTLTTGNNALITGNLTYGGADPNDPSAIQGQIEKGDSIDTPGSVGWVIGKEIEDAKASNNNTLAPAVDDSTNRLQGCDPSCTLHEGTYYLEEIDLGSSDELVIDTTGGPVDIAVDGDVDLAGAKVSLSPGSNPVRFHVDADLTLQGAANVTVPADQSPRLWFYMRSGSTATIQNNARLVGVVYGPGTGAHGGTEIDLKNNIEVFGALVGDVSEVRNGMGIHFDEGLTREDPLVHVIGGKSTITYLHITENRVTVSDT